MIDYYLLVVWGDVEPELRGPFDSEQQRDDEALEFRYEEGDEHGIYWLNTTPEEGKPEIGSYSGGFFKPVEERWHQELMEALENGTAFFCAIPG